MASNNYLVDEAIVDSYTQSRRLSELSANPNARAPAFSSEEADEGRYVHPTSKKLLNRCSSIRYIPIFGSSIESYGIWLTITLFVVYLLIKGIAFTLLALAYNGMFVNRFGVTTEEYTRYRAVALLGWSIKPFSALFSDVFPLFGYKKRWILTGSAFFSAVCCLGFGLLPALHSSAKPAVFLGFLAGWGQANTDILAEGLYSRCIRNYPAGGPKLVSAVWVPQIIGGFIGSVTQGPLSDAGIPQIGFFIASACALICTPFFALNGLQEKTNRVERLEDLFKAKEKAAEAETEVEETSFPPSEMERSKGPIYMQDECRGVEDQEEEEEELYIPSCCGGAIEFNKDILLRSKRVTFFCLFMTAVVVASAIAMTMLGKIPRLVFVTCSTVVLSGSLFWVFPIVIAKAGFFGFLTQFLYISVGSPLENFYMADEECVPNGPHFSQTFYFTISGVIRGAMNLVGVAAFTYILSRRSYRLTFAVTTFLLILGSMFDLVMVQRWNIAIGIPDHYMYIFGDVVVSRVVYYLSWLPLCLLFAQLCPRGSESMVYGILISVFNYGSTMSSQITSLMISFVWPVSNTKGACDFHNLWKLIVLNHCACPCLIIVAAFFLVPSARVGDELDEDGNVVERDRTSPAVESDESDSGGIGEETEVEGQTTTKR